MMKKAFFWAAFFVCIGGIGAAQTKTPSVTLNSGYDMPVFGLGTWTLDDAAAEAAVYEAIKNGYRLIDTAVIYRNETGVGKAVNRAIKEGLVTRQEVFITTKLNQRVLDPDKEIGACLKRLNIDYIDLVLLHHHGANDDKIYCALERGVKSKKIRSIGISNFYTDTAVNHFIQDFEVKPAVIQNENHLFHQSTRLQQYCKKYGIYIESYYPLGGRGHTKESLTNTVITRIAKAHNKTAAQIILRWHIQAGFIAIPGSKNPVHIKENIGIFDFELSQTEMNDIATLNINKRYENW